MGAHSDSEENNVRDTDVEVLARGLPEQLLKVHLSFEGCRHISNAGVESLAKYLPTGLEELSLDFSACALINDYGVEVLAQHLPPHLKILTLCFANCSKITRVGVQALARWSPERIPQFSALMFHPGVNRNFQSLRELRRFAGGWTPVFAVR